MTDSRQEPAASGDQPTDSGESPARTVPSLAELRQQHAAAQSHKRRADIEHVAVAAYGAGQGESDKWLAKTFGGTAYGYAQRLRVRNADAFGALWPLLDDGSLSLSQAANLVTACRTECARTGTPLAHAIRLRTAKLTAGGDEPKRELPRGQSLVFWQELRRLLIGYVQQYLDGCDPLEVEAVWRRFERDVKVLCEEWQIRLYDRRRQAAADGDEVGPVSRRLVTAACRTLAMDPPRRGRTIDLAKAERQKRRLAAAYHPDAHGGSEKMAEEYRRVLTAYATLEQAVRAATSTDDRSEPGRLAAYRELGLQPEASASEIGRAYRARAFTLHPDRNVGNPAALTAFKRLTAAYALLTDRKQQRRSP